MAYNTSAYAKVGTSFKKINVNTHWNLIAGKPESYVPTLHSHNGSDINNNSISLLKLSSIGAQVVLGRYDGVPGGVQELGQASVRAFLGLGTAAYQNTSAFVPLSGTSNVAGSFNTGSTEPTATNRINYAGYLYATRFYGNGSQITGLSASNINAGTLSVLRLGSSGTRNSTTYLAGDNTWKTLPSAGGISITKLSNYVYDNDYIGKTYSNIPTTVKIIVLKSYGGSGYCYGQEVIPISSSSTLLYTTFGVYVNVDLSMGELHILGYDYDVAHSYIEVYLVE